jgi:hypothetical protein
MEKSLKKTADRLVSIKGNVRGEVFRNTFSYVLENEGEEGVKALEEKLAELGHPLKFKEVDRMAWYPEGLSVLLVLLTKEVLNWKDSDVFKMGNSVLRYSFIIQFMVRHLISLDKVLEKAPILWDKHFDFGKLTILDANKKEKYARLAVEGHNFHEVACHYLAGYFLAVVQLCIKSDKITIEEVNCCHQGHPFDEFLIKWT